jgi:YihY family inner membrane protein
MASAAPDTQRDIQRKETRRERDARQDSRRDTGHGRQRVEEAVKKDVSTLHAFWIKFSNDWVFNLSAMLAYNFLMSAFPILLVLLAIGGLVLGATGQGGQSTLVSALSGALPNGTGQALMVNVTNNLHKSAGPLLVIGILVAVFTGSRLFITIENAFGIIFRLRGRDVIRQNVMAIGMMLLYAVLIPIVLLASILPSTIVRATPLGNNNPLAGFFVQAAGAVAAVLVAIILFGAIYFVVPNRPVKLSEVWRGTLVASALLVLYEMLFPIYLSLLLHPNNYGSTAGFAVVILIFFYYLAVILLLGAEINSWTSGQRQTVGDIDTILHEVQAHNTTHNTTRGAAGSTAGTRAEDLQGGRGARAVETPVEAVHHERTQHKRDAKPPQYVASGVDAPGYNIESDKQLHQTEQESGGEDDTANMGGEGDGSRVESDRALAQTGAAAASVRSNGTIHPTMGQRARVNSQLGARPLTDRQRTALGAVVATSALALVPLVRWTAQWLRGDTRPTALD